MPNVVRSLAWLCFLLTPAAGRAQSFPGTFLSNDGGSVTTLRLTRAGDGMTGSVSGDGMTFGIEGELDGSLLAGRVFNEDAAVHFHAEFEGAVLVFTMFQDGPDGTPNHDVAQSMAFHRQTSGGPSTAAPATPAPPLGPAPPGPRDPALVGRWVKEDRMTDATFSMTTQQIMVLTADGLIHEGAGRVVGGSAGVSFDSGTDPSDVSTAFWKSENGRLFLRAPDADTWANCCRYYIEDARMLITYDNGNRELWRKR